MGNHSVITIAVVGGSGSGKTTFAELLHQRLDSVLISQDDYYIPICGCDGIDEEKYNFDCPNALDFDLLLEHVCCLKKEKGVVLPQYDFVKHSRCDGRYITSKKVLLLEGSLLLSDSRLASEVDVSIYVKAPSKLRLKRRIDRDAVERGLRPEVTIKQYRDTVLPMHLLYVEPQISLCDYVVGNFGTIGDLRREADSFLDGFLEKIGKDVALLE